MTKTILAPAEAAAASLCWLSRFRLGNAVGGTTGGDRIAAKVEGFWHRGTCRWCQRPMAELMQLLNDTLGHPEFAKAEAAWKRLPPNVRTARVKEAQSASWLDEITT